MCAPQSTLNFGADQELARMNGEEWPHRGLPLAEWGKLVNPLSTRNSPPSPKQFKAPQGVRAWCPRHSDSRCGLCLSILQMFTCGHADAQDFFPWTSRDRWQSHSGTFGGRQGSPRRRWPGGLASVGQPSTGSRARARTPPSRRLGSSVARYDASPGTSSDFIRAVCHLGAGPENHIDVDLHLIEGAGSSMSTGEPPGQRLPRKQSRRKRDGLDAITQQRLNRFLARPKAPRPETPNPRDPRLRLWVINLAPDRMHAEVCRRLQDRWELIRQAFTSWMDDEFHEKRALKFPSLIQFLERVTINDLVAEWDENQHFLMLSDSGPRDIREEHLTEELVHLMEHHPYSIQNLRSRIKEQLLDWLFLPTRYDDKSFDEYDVLRRDLKARQKALRRGRTGWINLVKELLSTDTVTLAGSTYQVPAHWKDLLSATSPPSQVARLLLATRWQCDMQAAKELLVGLKKEWPIRSAWAHYQQWLTTDLLRIKDIRNVICRRPAILHWPRSWPSG